MASKSRTKIGGDALIHSYYFYAALLAIKLLALIPIGCLLRNDEKLRAANLSDLKHLTPFWLLAALYCMTSPDKAIAVALMRVFVIARIVTAVSYVCKGVPECAVEGAMLASFAITAFMGAVVVQTYINSF